MYTGEMVHSGRDFEEADSRRCCKVQKLRAQVPALSWPQRLGKGARGLEALGRVLCRSENLTSKV